MRRIRTANPIGARALASGSRSARVGSGPIFLLVLAFADGWLGAASLPESAVAVDRLPPLQIQGRPARAHTQGLEIVADNYYVTARREDDHPKRALLLRTPAAGGVWDVWDLTPRKLAGDTPPLDHPGGLQSDGVRLWIPLAESRRNSHSLIRAYRLAALVANAPLEPECEFSVNDHIGALAVSADRHLIYGANWDTERIYIWDFQGRLQRTLPAEALQGQGIGVATGPGGRVGLAIQDWKFVADGFFASGLFRSSPASAAASPQSRLIWFADFGAAARPGRSVTLPLFGTTELAREAMAVSAGTVYFLPEDLGASNRLFRISVADLNRHGRSLRPGSTPPP